jgi:hypothetical protein
VIAHVARTVSDARVDFDWGRLVLTATATELILQIQADAHALAPGQELIGRRVQIMGRREHLTVTWQPPDLS